MCWCYFHQSPDSYIGNFHKFHTCIVYMMCLECDFYYTQMSIEGEPAPSITTLLASVTENQKLFEELFAILPSNKTANYWNWTRADTWRQVGDAVTGFLMKQSQDGSGWSELSRFVTLKKLDIRNCKKARSFITTYF